MIIIGQIGKAVGFEQYFEATLQDTFTPHWNIQPGQSCQILTSELPHAFTEASYGMVPFWLAQRKDYTEAPVDGGLSSDSEAPLKIRIIQDPAFRRPIRETRCIIPADYFICQQNGMNFLFFHQDRSPIALAGVYDRWKPTIMDRDVYTGFSLLTLPAHGIFAQLGIDRAPFILDSGKHSKWIRGNAHLVEVTRLIEPCKDSLLNAYEVGTEKISAQVNDRTVIMPIGEFIRPYKEHNGLIGSFLRSQRYRFNQKSDSEKAEPKIWQ